MFALQALAVLVCLCAVSAWPVSNRTCPAPESLPNCYCMTQSYLFPGPFVVCSNIQSVDALHASLRGLKNHPVDALELYNVSLPNLPRDGLFQDMHIDYLWLSTSSFKSFAPRDNAGPSIFTGLEESVAQIKLEFLNNLEVLDWEELSVLKKLNYIDINHIRANQIGDNFSKLPTAFKNLKLFDSFVTKIDSKAFALPSLITLSVEGNRNLTTIPRGAFLPNAANLTQLWLGLNGLRVLPDDFFQGMPSLTFVDIARNKFATFPSSLVSVLPQLESVYLASNPLRCDCGLVGLRSAFNQTPPKYSDLDYMVCASPAKLSGRKFKSLNEGDLCP